MQNKVKKTEAGFTLVEAVVVLVIIGLVLGSIFKVQEFIDNARSDKFITTIQGLQGAYYAFHAIRGEFPGDINGDKRIEYDAVGQNDGTFFQDMFDAGVSYSAIPEMPLEGAGIFYANFLDLNTAPALNVGVIRGVTQLCATLVEDKYARHLDSKLDDGISNTGLIQSLSVYGTVNRHTVCYKL